LVDLACLSTADISEPLEPGWFSRNSKLALAGLRIVDIQLSTLAGKLKVCINLQTRLEAGEMTLVIPLGATAEDFALEG
jgi:hypothetical protein